MKVLTISMFALGLILGFGCSNAEPSREAQTILQESEQLRIVGTEKTEEMTRLIGEIALLLGSIRIPEDRISELDGVVVLDEEKGKESLIVLTEDFWTFHGIQYFYRDHEKAKALVMNLERLVRANN